MKENIQISEVFDHTLVSLTKALAGIELEKAETKSWEAKDKFVETINTKGKFDSYILCEIEADLFEHIVTMMHGGSPPTEEEKVLYINEYINIICGRAISAINNELRVTSRLSIPTFHGRSLNETEKQEKAEQRVLWYQTEKGSMRFVIYYTFQ